MWKEEEGEKRGRKRKEVKGRERKRKKKEGEHINSEYRDLHLNVQGIILYLLVDVLDVFCDEEEQGLTCLYKVLFLQVSCLS